MARRCASPGEGDVDDRFTDRWLRVDLTFRGAGAAGGGSDAGVCGGVAGGAGVAGQEGQAVGVLTGRAGRPAGEPAAGRRGGHQHDPAAPATGGHLPGPPLRVPWLLPAGRWLPGASHRAPRRWWRDRSGQARR